MKYKTMADYVGNTPLVKLQYMNPNPSNTILLKLEGNNPAGSVKDRPALNMIKAAQARGEIQPGDTLIEPTSGNTGIALAMAAAVQGFKMILVMPETMTIERRSAMTAYGAELILVSAEQGMEGARDVALQMQAEGKGKVLDQFANPDNTAAHYETTGPEIWRQSNGKITHLVVCSGTGGTISGTARFLKEKNPKIKIIGVDAYGSVLKKYHETGEFDENEIYPYRIEGLGKNLIPSVTDFEIIDKYVKVSDEDSAHSAREIVKNEGIFAGYTSGAAFQAVKQLSQENEFKDSDLVVVIFPDHGSRYLSKIYSDKWMENQGFSDSKHEINNNDIQYIRK